MGYVKHLGWSFLISIEFGRKQSADRNLELTAYLLSIATYSTHIG